MEISDDRLVLIWITSSMVKVNSNLLKKYKKNYKITRSLMLNNMFILYCLFELQSNQTFFQKNLYVLHFNNIYSAFASPSSCLVRGIEK